MSAKLDSSFMGKIKDALKNRTLLERTFLHFCNRNPLRIATDIDVRELSNQCRAYYKVVEFCDQYYRYYETQYKPLGHSLNSNNIWICWFQGWNEVPYVVEQCKDSILYHSNGYRVNLIDEKSINELLNVPSYVEEKWRNKVISTANYSDIIRLLLLDKYGGMWIDSTVYCTDDFMFNRLKSEELFVYKNFNNKFASISSWLIRSFPHDKIIFLTLKLLLEFWKHHDVAFHG